MKHLDRYSTYKGVVKIVTATKFCLCRDSSVKKSNNDLSEIYQS